MLDEYFFRVANVGNLADIQYNDSKNQEMFGKSHKKESSIDFGNIFKTACDELKQNQAAHTKARVITLSRQSTQLLAQ